MNIEPKFGKYAKYSTGIDVILRLRLASTEKKQQGKGER